MGTQKISIDMNGIAIAVETDNNDAIEILKATIALAQENRISFSQQPAAIRPEHSAHVRPAAPSDSQPARREGTLNVVAAKLGSGSGREILWAAAVFFTFYQNKAKWTREEWMATVKESRDWKAQYSSGAARDIARMIKSQVVNETATDVFSLPTSSLAEIESQLE